MSSPKEQRASVLRALEGLWPKGPEAVLDALPDLMLRWPEAFGMASSDSSDGKGPTYRRVSLGRALGS